MKTSKVYKLSVSDEQYKVLYSILDSHLKSNGLAALKDVVSIYNILVSGEEQSLEKEEK